ncbi:unnamed protein product [Effrenium voratum]|uniref:J domain-containing protein n=1 Tax=Effrenium voratum TaxID=2562239 RepID=A0AA36HNP7_9DINO|nr:unnamed protein product [Effrenium voratum]CAJ1418801.1 unnamed protein product [Effrenium voratum]
MPPLTDGDLYSTLGVSPCASDPEIRSAYKRRALATHPDKGGLAEDFLQVVSAFEILTDTARRRVYDQRHKPKPKHKRKESKADAKAQAKSDAQDPTSDARATHAAAAKPEAQVDFRGLLRKLLGAKKVDVKRVELSALHLQEFLGFLKSETEPGHCDAESGLEEDSEDMLALCDDVSEEAAHEKAVESSQKHAARTTLRGVNWRSPGYMASVGFRHLNVYSHLVHDLDAAIDMHISLVRLRQGVCDQLIAGIDHYQALRHGLDTMDAERRAAGLVKMRLRFNTYYRGKKTPRTQDLDEVVRQWANAEQQFAQAQLARKEKKRKLEQIRAELTQQKQTEREHQKKEKDRQVRQQHIEQLRRWVEEMFQQHLRSRFQVSELPEGLRLASFQGDADCVCAQLHLHGAKQLGPYRRSVKEASRDLLQLSALQQRGDEVALRELRRRDTEAMTAFFMETMK